MSSPLSIYARNGRSIQADEVENVLAAIRQQGPDGQGVWCEGAVGLGHLALLETPEMRFESQPAPLDRRIDATSPRDIVISADLRLDNRAELASKLQIPATLLPSLGDSQLVLAAYLRWGEACPQQLLGDFAFVIWDGPQRKLFCARDPLGVKPLFTYIRPDLCLIAGDVRALVAHPQGPHQPNEQALVHYLREGHLIHPSMTFLQGVDALLPAHTLTISEHQTTLRRYWFPEQSPAIQVTSLAAAAEQLRALLEDAVRVRLRRVQGVGAHMSGGLDSTSIAYIAAHQLRAEGADISTYSWQPSLNNGVHNEANHAANDAARATSEYATLYAAIRDGNLDHTEINVTPVDVVNDLVRDICLHHAQMFMYEPLVRQAAASRQARILLSGWGGDELISGHGGGYLAESFWRGDWANVVGHIAAQPVPPGKNVVRHRAGIFYEHVVKPSLPNVLYDWLSSPPDNNFLGENAYLMCTSAEFAAQVAHLPPLPQARRYSKVRALQLALLNQGHLHRRMESWAAEGADDHMIYRYPLLDRRLVEFALGLPRHAYRQGQIGRYLFRLAMSNTLPSEVCWGVAKMEPVRVGKWTELTRAALLPAFNATLDHLATQSQVQPRLKIEPLRQYMTRDPKDENYDLGDVGVTMRAIQLLGAGGQLPK